jgi:hypothetical protein
MARIRSQNGGELILQKDTLLPLEDSRKKGRPKLRWLDSVLKYVRTLKVEARWKKALYRNIWGGSSKRPRSIKNCRARRTRRRIQRTVIYTF